MSTTRPRFDLPSTPSYFGGKGAPGTVRTILNLLPPHDIYIEPFLGSGRIMRHKAPAHFGSIGMETDPTLCAEWHTVAPADVHVVNADALTSLERTVCALCEAGANPARILVYCDPPYLMHTRKSSAPVYHREWCEQDHIAFLMMVHRLRCMVMVSHLPCAEYATALASWHTHTFNNVTRHGLQLEQLWYNYPPPVHLHEYTYVGRNFRERERFKRQAAIIRRRVAALPPSARLALLASLEHLTPGDDAGE